MNTSHLLNKRLLIFLLTVLVSVLSIFRVLPHISVAQSATRNFEIRIPKHLPIKVQLKKDKEKSLKEMKNDKWLRDFELEVENVGTKPIFFLHLMVIFPDIRTEGNDQIMFPLYYGRPEIGDIKTKAAPDDVPINPGQTYVFKIFPSQIPAWESNVQEKRYSEPEKVEIVFEIMSFGDGTGFAGTDGIALPHKIDQAKQCPVPDSRGDPEASAEVVTKSLDQPASFLPVKFLSGSSDVPAVLKISASTRTTPDSCCSGWDCEYIVFNTANICLNCTSQTQIEDVFCSFEFGFCRHVTYGSVECTLPNNGGRYLCRTISLTNCTETPGPSPSPSPSPSPCTCADQNATPADCSNGITSATCPFGEVLRNGCCYPGTCDPMPTPPTCQEGYRPGSFRPFPDCYYGPCIPIPPQDATDPDYCQHYNWFWNFQGSGCYEEEQVCPNHCVPYQPLESGGCESAVDYCQFNYGCGFGFTDGGQGCCCGPTPVLIDVAGNGFSLTDAYTGVFFDMGGDGKAEPIAWPSTGSDDAWLVLDRNHNGKIDSGKEMFGNFTDQPHATTSRNGFVALAEFDRVENGGNNDRRIDSNDAVFTDLRLWQDLNHNGISEPQELSTLSSLGLATIELKYKESKKTDDNGNQFGYRAKIKDAHGAQLGRWAWDVTLSVNPPPKKL